MWNNRVILIGLCGRAGAGKNAVADGIQKFYGDSLVVQLAFADAVKEIARSFGWNGKKDERGRRLLQVVGTEAGREYDPNIWINKVDAKVTEAIQRHVLLQSPARPLTETHPHVMDLPPSVPPLVILLTDVRFSNEYDFITSSNGVLVWVERPRHTGADVGITDATKLHVSETSFREPHKHCIQILNHYKTVEHFQQSAWTCIATHLVENYDFPKSLA